MDLKYEYRAIRTRNMIRLIELSPGSTDDPLVHCTIKHTNLAAAAGGFEALSYTWGSPQERGYISCGDNREILQVPMNCVTALSALRHDVHARTLWVDAICIDQSNIEERNAQVKIMGKIFATAWRVVVFLGASTAGSQLLFQNLAQADACINDPNQQEQLEAGEDVAHEIQQLLLRPWFSRIWVVQEIFHARETIFVCGCDSASLEALWACLFGYAKKRRLVMIFPPPLQIKQYLSEISELQTPTQQVFEYLLETGLCISSDPRDKLLALLPLATMNPLYLENLIDYNKKIEEIFLEFTLLALSDESIGLRLLRTIRHPHSRKMPSWVPDWSCVIDNTRKSDRRCRPNTDINLRPHRVDTSSRKQPTHTLVIYGVRYATIAEVGPIIQIDSKELELAWKWAYDGSFDVDAVASATGSALMLRFGNYPPVIREGTLLRFIFIFH